MWLHLVAWSIIYWFPTTGGKDVSLFTVTYMHIPVLPTSQDHNLAYEYLVFTSWQDATQLSHVVVITENLLFALALVIVSVYLLGFQCSYLPRLYKPQTHPQLYKPPLSSFSTFSIDQVNNFFFKKSFPELLTVSHRPGCSRRPLLSSWVFLSFLSCVDLCPGSCDILLLEMFPPIFWWNTFLCSFLNRAAWKVISFAISNVPKVFILPFHFIDDFCKYGTLSWNHFLSEFGKHFSLSSSFQCCKVWCQLDSWIFTGNLEFFSFGTVLNSFFNNFFTSIFILLSSWVLS